jgi:hypothetical protein
MGRPTHSDPDLDKRASRPPAAGKRSAHRRQTPGDYAPQRPAQDDLRKPLPGDQDPAREGDSSERRDDVPPRAPGWSKG